MKLVREMRWVIEAGVIGGMKGRVEFTVYWAELNCEVF